MKMGRWGSQCLIDKIDFLKTFQQARIDAITEENVWSSWRKSGLFPSNPQVVSQELPIISIVSISRPPSRLMTSGEPVPLPDSVLTPADVASVQEILRKNQKINSQLTNSRQSLKEFLIILRRCAILWLFIALTEYKLTHAANADLVEVSKRMKLHSKKSGSTAGDTRVLSQAGWVVIMKIKARKAQGVTKATRLVAQKKDLVALQHRQLLRLLSMDRKSFSSLLRYYLYHRILVLYQRRLRLLGKWLAKPSNSVLQSIKHKWLRQRGEGRIPKWQLQRGRERRRRQWRRRQWYRRWRRRYGRRPGSVVVIEAITWSRRWESNTYSLYLILPRM